ncbi:hypothetical protein CONCODRAFT_3466 [Conidiobolus coronatus NRRL 28638]|uniref:Uncharacterized protein n=1 Tax=Conidiobolus coronatus (strain ATCC 28846 / CBS 209.66 / NRRL 28638) TaxID=796925 RepID=A0A137PEV0_CONC2|nr:hypothetical protein CONCODRAFT_3466 [Conidiobolus coronatus NRRL 28638]|eukprot:KXN73510.1 hypothetical protein CONCODRAFT_3466 [Conidiobolus coronatus NRRL 28638]
MIQALVILLLIDDSINRYPYKCARLVTIIKLAQAIGIDNPGFNLNYNQHKISPLTVQKLLLFVKYFNNETSNIYNLPKLLKFNELKCDDYNIRENFHEDEFVKNSYKALQKNYLLSFMAYKSVNYVFQKVDELERDIGIKSASSSFKDAFNIIQFNTRLYQSLPSDLKHTMNCLNSEYISKNPISRHQIFLSANIKGKLPRL